MQKPILYYIRWSPPVKTVQLTAKYIGLDIELSNVDLFASENMKPEFLKMNPQHTVPTLNDNGRIIWDSHAIICYLIDEYAQNDSLYPKDNFLRARVDQRLHFESGILYECIRQCMEPVIRRGKFDYPTDGLKLINQAYDFLEMFLKGDPYLVGNQLTVADLSCVTTLLLLDFIVTIDFIKYPKIKKWIDRLHAELPDYEEIVITTTEELRNMYKQMLIDNKMKAN